MINRYGKRCATSLIKEIHIKSTLNPFTHVKIAITKKKNDNKFGAKVEDRESLYTVGDADLDVHYKK
jgi:hypothetical protein